MALELGTGLHSNLLPSSSRHLSMSDLSQATRIRCHAVVRSCYQTQQGSDHSPAARHVATLSSTPEVEAATFLSSPAADEMRRRGQRLPISNGRLPTFLAPTTVVSTEHSSEDGVPASSMETADVSYEEHLLEFTDLDYVAGLPVFGGEEGWLGETAGSYKARADVMLKVGGVMAQRFREATGAVRS